MSDRYIPPDASPGMAKALNRIWDALDSLLDAHTVDLNGRRVGGAQAAVMGDQYVTLRQMTEALGGIPQPPSKADVTYGQPVDLAEATADGQTSTAAKADHKHGYVVKVKSEGADVAVRQAICFTGAGVTVTDDPMNNQVLVDIP